MKQYIWGYIEDQELLYSKKCETIKECLEEAKTTAIETLGIELFKEMEPLPVYIGKLTESSDVVEWIRNYNVYAED